MGMLMCSMAGIVTKEENDLTRGIHQFWSRKKISLPVHLSFRVIAAA